MKKLIAGCKEKVPNLPKEKALQEEVMEKKVIGMKTNLHPLHHLLHLLLHKHLHTLPLIQPLLILIIILKKELENNLYLKNSSCPCIMVKWTQRSLIIGFVNGRCIVEFITFKRMISKFSWLHWEWRVQHSFGGKKGLKTRSKNMVRSLLLGLISLLL